MIQYIGRLGNLILRWDYTEHNEFPDMYTITLNKKEYNRFRKFHGGEVPYFDSHMHDEVRETLKRDGEIDIYHTDVIILYMNYLMTEHSEETHILVGSGVLNFWFVHDYFHAKNDVQGGTVYVDPQIEEQRIEDAAKWFVEHDMNVDWCNFTFVDELETAFFQRFRVNPKFTTLAGIVEDSYEYDEEE